MAYFLSFIDRKCKNQCRETFDNIELVSIENTDDVRARMTKTINIAKAGNVLENLRTKSENINLLQTFVSYFVIHVTTSIYWQYNACDIVVLKIFTESNDALCILLIENNAEDYAKIHREQKRVSRKEAKPKYTKVESSDKNLKAGIEEIFIGLIVLCAEVKKNGELSESKDMEMQLKSRYIELFGK